MKGIIYKYTFSDGKVYIGQTRRPQEIRKREHLNAIMGPTSSGFWDAYKRLGEPKYEVLYEVEIENMNELISVLNYLETVFIHKYHADDPEFGYNRMSYGRVASNTRSILRKKYKELLGELTKERMQTYYSAEEKIWRTKEPLTKEELFLIKEKYRSDNIYQSQIDKYDFTNLSEINEAKDFFLEEGLDYVRFLLNEEIEEEASRIISENYETILQEELSKKTIVQLDNNGNVVREFNSFNEICQAFNVPRADNVRNVLKGRQKSAYGFFWNYKKDIS